MTTPTDTPAVPAAMPPDLADYMLRHLQEQRAALDGFLSIGNETGGAQLLDDWIAWLEDQCGPWVVFTDLNPPPTYEPPEPLEWE